MKTTPLATTNRVPAAGKLERSGTFADWLQLLRPRVAAMVFLVGLLGTLLAQGPSVELLRSLEAVLYITLVTGAASILNQVLERDTDAAMRRTCQRPLVRGTVAVRDAILLAALLGITGVAGLVVSFNLLAAFLTLATLTAYVTVYTPLKRVSSLNTVIGAIPGAAPPLLGYVALAGQPGPWAWLLFAILFAWQFPHFMAIAWIYREDYARAEMRMLPCLPGSEGMAGRQAVLYALAILPVSLLPVTQGMAGPVYGIGALVLGFVYLGASIAFAHREELRRARMLLFVSLAYLPLLFAFILFDPIVRAAILS